MTYKAYFPLIGFLTMFSVITGRSQTQKKVDSSAVFILDKMAQTMGDLESVSFSLHTITDESDAQGHITSYYQDSQVTMTGPNKLSAMSKGDQGNHGYWYDGDYLSYYSFDENNYVTLEAPETILTMIDSMHMAYDFKFPAADFFYPSFTDDILEGFDEVLYKGENSIEDSQCYTIQAQNNQMSMQLWISKNEWMLPKRLVIHYKDSGERYEASFSNWSVNQNIPESIYSFLPPPNAKLISILAKS